ncbi:peptide deformylase [Candidatus Parcubacteria bacterium]|nr:peptide deformylase [Candidatus Parcubacteria bacterium]
MKILQKEDPVLRKIALEVPIKDIQSKKIQSVIKKMSKILSTQDDGVAIAAPQIGESLRIFVVSGKVFTMKRGKDRKMHADADAQLLPDMIFINPKITKLSKKKQSMEEGCLSVRWLYGRVVRSEKATVHAYDEHGKAFTKGASGLLAQAFQHEIDHLDGILFIDKATDIEDLPPETAKNE